MINYRKEIVTEEKEIVTSVTCDICGKVFDYSDNTDEVFEIQEFVHINFIGGYGSVFGDGDHVRCDICQNCLKERLGSYLRIEE